MMRILLLASLALVVDPTAARACTQKSVPLADAVDLSDALVVAQVVSSKVTSPSRSGTTATLSIHVRVKSIVAGTVQPNTTLKLSYSEPMPMHRSGGRTRCPLWVGSGIEFSLETGRSYTMLLAHGNNQLVRAVSTSKSKALLGAWSARHWSNVSAKQAKRAQVVMRAAIVRFLGGSKYHWTRVRPLKIFKNTSGRKFKAPLRIAQYGTSPQLKRGTCTLYLEPYAAKSTTHWKLLDGKPSSGTSHHQTAKSRKP